MSPLESEPSYDEGMALDERAFFTDRPETRQGRYQCPRCQRTNDYAIRWVRRSKKDRPPANANEEDRAKFAKLRDYLLRLDDEVICKTCGKKFEIPSQHSLMFVDELSGLPDEEALEREIAAASGDTEPTGGAKAPLPARFTRRSSGWK
jgi:transcription elongation factor Elf1